MEAFVPPLLGGVLLGLSVSLMLLFNGRVTGISGILNGALTYVKGDWLWRGLFVLGLILGGLVVKTLNPDTYLNLSERSGSQIIIAGLLVGFGTVMGSGCTSGHGVCGISRLSPRSIIATLAFMVSGILIVYIVRSFMGVA